MSNSSLPPLEVELTGADTALPAAEFPTESRKEPAADE
jgi:hypothetical protein